MTHNDSINWSEVLKNTTVSAVHGNDNNRIVAATEILQQTAQQFVQVLNERARLLANSAQFEAALRDAAAIRTMLPGSGLGYLCTGNVYCQQGHHAAAIAIFDQGLEAVPESDVYYQQLQQHRSTAITNSSKRIDFISLLPLDIVITNILPGLVPRFYKGSSYDFLYVSRAWQERILKQPKGLHFAFGADDQRFKHSHDQLVKFAPYIQTLEGSVNGDAHLDELFSRASFSKLKELKIYCINVTPPRPLLKGLHLVADSLTHLEIWCRGCIRLRDILETCPNLSSLIAEEAKVTMPSLSSSTIYPKMTHLKLVDLPAKPIKYRNMINILSHFPSLLSLEIMPMPGSNILPILHKYCPHLQVLFYGDEHINFMTSIDVQPNQKGITFARLTGNEDYMQDDLVRFLHLHQHSLETFHCGYVAKNDSPLWELSNGRTLSNGHHLASLPPEENPARSETLFKRLSNIEVLADAALVSETFFVWLISNAPNLKDITCVDSHLQPCITKVMAKLKHLSKLKIFHTEGNRDFQGIIELLKYHAAMRNQSTLKELVIILDQKMSEATWLPLISKLACLKRLKLEGGIPKECIPTMAEIGQGCPALEELSLEMWGGELADGVMESLRPLSNLKSLQVKGKSLSSSDLVILTTFPSLQKLNVRCGNQVPDYIVQLLYKHIPKVMIE